MPPHVRQLLARRTREHARAYVSPAAEVAENRHELLCLRIVCVRSLGHVCVLHAPERRILLQRAHGDRPEAGSIVVVVVRIVSHQRVQEVLVIGPEPKLDVLQTGLALPFICLVLKSHLAPPEQRGGLEIAEVALETQLAPNVLAERRIPIERPGAAIDPEPLVRQQLLQARPRILRVGVRAVS